MSGISKLAAWAVLGLLIVAPGTQAAPVSLSHFEPLQRLNIQRSGAAETSQKISVAGPVDLSFDALGRSFELQLTPNSSLLDAAREASGGTIVPYRGQLRGIPDSWARIVISNGAPAGVIWDGTELFAIERPGDNLADADTTIVYRLADAIIAPGTMTCGAGGELTSGSDLYKSLVSELNAASAQAEGAESEIDIGIVADAEFYDLHAGDPSQAIIDRMSLVDGYFSEQVGIQINWPLVQVFSNASSPSYPFSATVVASDLLGELSTYREGEANQNVNGLTHLWTGKDVEGGEPLSNTTVGIAYVGGVGQGQAEVLCSSRLGVGLSEGRRDATLDSLIAAHEIGHNFGAPHDGAPESACSAETSDYIMATSLSSSNNRFSQCSLDQMADDIAQAELRGCVAPLPSVDMSFGLADPALEVLLGNTATVTFDVINGGTLPATNVAADFTLPTNVSLISAAASMGTCTDGGGVVNCAIGDVDGITTITVTLTSDTTAVGSGTFSASVAADTDDDPTNNQNSLTLNVQPAVNLSVTPPSARQLGIDQSTGLTALLENTSILDATGVTLSVAVSAGLRVDSASWPLGTCSVSDTQIDCEGATFAAQSNTTLSLGVTATSEGSKSISFSMASAEAEADPANNSANATVNVSAPQEDSGGGGAGLWLLPLLGMLATRRRKAA
jgi:uncharacterized repeat protein (TIGR01451 family)/MYXO-CTERM domain-containing protein